MFSHLQLNLRIVVFNVNCKHPGIIIGDCSIKVYSIEYIDQKSIEMFILLVSALIISEMLSSKISNYAA